MTAGVAFERRRAAFRPALVLAGLLAVMASRSAAAPTVIEARVGQGAWTRTTSVLVLPADTVQLRVAKQPDATVAWYRIVPDISVRYNNAEWPWMPGAYTWKGFDEIRYETLELTRFRGQWQIEPFAGVPEETRSGRVARAEDGLLAYLKRRLIGQGKAERSVFSRPDRGSFWYQARVTRDAETSSSPGVESRDERGLSPEVFRLSIREGTDLIGNLTSYFNVPAVFGSTPYQVRNYIGVDCADVLMAAWSMTKGSPYEKDYNVAMLTGKFPVVKEFELRDGAPDPPVAWVSGVRVGDFIAVRYEGAGQFQHVGVLYRDANSDGSLDSEDLVLHAGPDPLHLSRLSGGAFDGTAVVLRPD